MRTTAEVLGQFPASAADGLSAAECARSRERYGDNRLTPLPREPLWQKFLDKFDEPIIKILLAAALLSMVVELFKLQEHGPFWGGVAIGLLAVLAGGAWLLRKPEWLPALLFGLAVALFGLGLALGHALVEGLAVTVAVVLATGVAFLSEYRSDREFEALNARKDSIRVKVRRDGAVRTVPLEATLVGDLVLLETGDEVPADGRVLHAANFDVDQSLMTGESEPASKKPAAGDADAASPDRPDCLYRGTQVVHGAGRMLVTEVGDATALGRLARRLSAEDGGEFDGGAGQRLRHKLSVSKALTPLQQKLERLARLISKVGYGAAALIFVAQLIRGCVTGEIHWPVSTTDAVQVFGALLDYFVLMVIIIVVAVPEGLPMSVTVSLALAMRKMTRAHCLVRQLVACETIGSATVICTDKTGTLTQNRMRVERVSWADRTFDRGGPDWTRLDFKAPRPDAGTPEQWLVLNAAVNSTANLEEKQGKQLVVGNNTEGAVLRWLSENAIDYRLLRVQFAPLHQTPFSSERKRMTTVVRLGERPIALVKGAPEWLLENSTRYQAADGGLHGWTPEARAAVREQLRAAASEAMRTLAFGYVVLPPDAAELRVRSESPEGGLIYTGFVAIRDPLRDDAKEALARCRQAGIEVKMITGDNVETARAIAADLGLIERRDGPTDAADPAVLTSATFNELSDEELKARLPRLRVLARALPLDKFRMVRLLQELGEVVAVTGDGTNDAPALKKADVGLAMGIAGTEVAKEASKIVLLDDSFATIVRAVQWGRSLYENIQRFLQFQLTINVSALAVAFLGTLLFGVRPPFTVLQLLWINVIMDTFASIALCSEPPRAGVLRVPPKRRDESIVTPAMRRTIFVTAAFFVVVMLALLGGMRWGRWFAGDGPASADFPELTIRQVSIFFSVYVFFQVWNQINCRSLVPQESGLARLWTNPTFLLIAGVVAVGQVLIVTFGGSVFKVEPLSPPAWLGVIGFTASVLAFGEIERRIRAVS